MTPALCEEKTNVVLISKPFALQSEAEQFAEGFKDAAGAVPTAIVQMEDGKLPNDIPFLNEGPGDGEAAPEEAEAGILDELTVLLENGKYLCKTPEGSVLFSRPYIPDAAQDNENVLMEELLVKTQAGREDPFVTQNFYGVEEAAFSYDGRYLAILDSGVVNKVLYVYDTLNEECTNLAKRVRQHHGIVRLDEKIINIYAMKATGDRGS
jgi:hypothetical protein